MKNEDTFPLKSIEYCLSELPKGNENIDAVAIPSRSSSYWYSLKRKGKWTIDDYLEEQHKYWFPKLIGGKEVDELSYLTHCIDTDQYPSSFWKESLKNKQMADDFNNKYFLRIIADALKVDEKIIYRIDHHRCHAYYGYYASPFRNRPVMVMTIDGWGDDSNASINIFDPDSAFKCVSKSTTANIGRIYRYITLLLGMKPNEHEYKVMGLAPYSKDEIARKPYEIFKSTLYVDGIEFKWNVKPSDSYFWFKKELEGCRFDGIAAGMQRWTEELLCDWVRNAINEFGVNDVILSGGVAMNIKANCEIAKLSEVKSFFVPGAPSDDSLAIGAAYALAEDITTGSGLKWDASRIPSPKDLYLGPTNNYEDEQRAISEIDSKNWEVLRVFSAFDLANLLAEGKIIARCAERMEFGARALCNRSILADPIHMEAVPKINSAIKNRDFWMPFAPVIMDKWADKYIVNPKRIEATFMTIGFESTAIGWKKFPAACHQADRSVRPQILTREANPEMYKILEEFEKITGRGALLNTSFNLHGYPIVNTAKDALHVFINSGLDALVLNHFLIKKKNSVEK